MLLECLEPDLYGPVTILQCLRRHGHTKVCIKDAAQEALYIRTVQAAFLEKTLAEQWSQPLVKKCIEQLPGDALEAFRFLRDIPNKDNYATDEALFTAIKNSENSELILETFTKVLETQKPKAIVACFSSLVSKNPATRKPIIDKAIAAIMATATSREENAKLIAISERLFTYFSGFVPAKYQKSWEAFKVMMEEHRRVSDQLHHEILCYAYSTSQKKAVEQENGLYEHLENFARSEEPATYWAIIPDSLKKEYALSFTALLHRLIASPAKNVAPKVYEDLLAEFTKSCAKLPCKTSIQAMNASVKFLNKIASNM